MVAGIIVGVTLIVVSPDLWWAGVVIIIGFSGIALAKTRDRIRITGEEGRFLELFTGYGMPFMSPWRDGTPKPEVPASPWPPVRGRVDQVVDLTTVVEFVRVFSAVRQLAAVDGAPAILPRAGSGDRPYAARPAELDLHDRGRRVHRGH